MVPSGSKPLAKPMLPYGVARAYRAYWDFIAYLFTNDVSSLDKGLAVSFPFYIPPTNTTAVPIDELMMKHFRFKIHAWFLCRNSASLKRNRIRKTRDYGYGNCQYKVLSMKNRFKCKSIREERYLYDNCCGILC